jgi:ketosteroid isomerase-like protein
VSKSNADVALAFIDAMSRGDAEAIDACLTPDAVAYAMGFGKLSGSRGRDEIVANTGAFKQLMPTGLRPTYRSITAEGERVVVEFDGDAVLANGVDYRNQYCMVFTLADGRITRLNEYYCTILADDRIGPLLMDVEAQRNATQA